jgi:hypothetical protein
MLEWVLLAGFGERSPIMQAVAELPEELIVTGNGALDEVVMGRLMQTSTHAEHLFNWKANDTDCLYRL